MNNFNGIIVTTDLDRNLIETVFQGSITRAEIEQYETDIAAALALVRAEFILFSDLTPLESMAQDCIPHIERVMDNLRKGGIGRIVRVIPHPSKDIGLSIMSLFHYPRGLPIVTCQTRDEAERALH